MIKESIDKLLNYALDQTLIEAADIDFTMNQLSVLLQFEPYAFVATASPLQDNIDDILQPILDHAVTIGLIENDTVDERDLFDTKVMGLLMPRPSCVNQNFTTLYQNDPTMATKYFYDISQSSNYIRTQRVAKDKRWQVETVYGKLDMTINLSKPEKDPKTIAAAKLLPTSSYPKCLLCKENVGFAGHLNHPARQNLRIIPVTLAGQEWYFQYSPYVYYNEHCIMLKKEHEPMAITSGTFARILDFVRQFKHYFAGSNADLPIVGGSILSHDHFQGGNYRFAMDDATVVDTFAIPGFPEVAVELLNWPLTTLRLKGEDINKLTKLGEKILTSWRGYSDESLGIHAFTGDTPHNTITPIARYRDGLFELDLVLRNNRTNDEHPDGIYHPHAKYHHLKKENIGLIEVMGLAVLPGRLLAEIDVVKEALIKTDESILTTASLEKHIPWYQEMLPMTNGMTDAEIEQVIEKNIGLKFAEILACCGVFKLDDAGLAGVKKFVGSLM